MTPVSPFPTQLGLGELHLHFPEGIKPKYLSLDTESGRIEIFLSNGTSDWCAVVQQDIASEFA